MNETPNSSSEPVVDSKMYDLEDGKLRYRRFDHPEYVCFEGEMDAGEYNTTIEDSQKVTIVSGKLSVCAEGEKVSQTHGPEAQFMLYKGVSYLLKADELVRFQTYCRK